MIDKQRFGRRVAGYRHSLQLSQAELADKVCVSAQAVSKWETGAALPDIELLLQLSALFHITINDLLQDNLLPPCLPGRSFAFSKGIPCFVPPMTDPEWLQWEQDMHQQHWVEKNWNTARGFPGGWEETSPLAARNRLSDLHTGQKIARRGGIILEIGAGPGGGYAPFILQADPMAHILLSDLSHAVVHEWKSLLDKESVFPNLSYAALDFCSIPFRDCSIDVVSDHGGIINCIGDRSSALREIFRVLKPGGVLVSLNGFVTKDTLSALPTAARATLISAYPDLTDDLYAEQVLAGFHRIDSEISGTWNTDEDESDLADLARALGIRVEFTQYVRYCTK